jgi:hypothetical protein
MPRQPLTLDRSITDRKNLLRILHDLEAGRFLHLRKEEKDDLLAGVKQRLSALGERMPGADEA